MKIKTIQHTYVRVEPYMRHNTISLALVSTFRCVYMRNFLAEGKTAEINFTSPVINIPCSPRMCVRSFRIDHWFIPRETELLWWNFSCSRRKCISYRPQFTVFFRVVFIQCSIAVKKDFCVNFWTSRKKWVNEWTADKVIAGCGKHFRGFLRALCKFLQTHSVLKFSSGFTSLK